MSLAPTKFEGSKYPDIPDYAPNSDDRTWGLLVHLSPYVAWLLGGMTFLGPLIIWLIKKDQSPFMDDQGKEALNFQISLWLAIVICCVTVIGILLVPIVAIAGLIYHIIAGMEANKGIYYRYPYILRLIK